MPKFRLKNTSNTYVSSSDVMGIRGLVVLFTCNHCPYAIALWNRIINDYQFIQKCGFNLIAINPNNNPDYPDDSFENMVHLVNQKNIPFEYLWDESQVTAKAYDAQCTPDIFMLNNSYELIYRGAYDDNWKSEEDVRNRYVLEVAKIIMSGTTVPKDFGQPSMGCSIKWVRKN
ncbi:MAG: thioredoxin family protein [Candidatus Marinamargulisbacteria bacterium]